MEHKCVCLYQTWNDKLYMSYIGTYIDTYTREYMCFILYKCIMLQCICTLVHNFAPKARIWNIIYNVKSLPSAEANILVKCDDIFTVCVSVVLLVKCDYVAICKKISFRTLDNCTHNVIQWISAIPDHRDRSAAPMYKYVIYSVINLSCCIHFPTKISLYWWRVLRLTINPLI